MTNYIIPSITLTSETLDLSGLMYPCRITDLRLGTEYVLESAEGSPILIGPDTTPPVGPGTGRPAYTGASSIPYFNTTLGKPIWYNGNDWVDATGTNVDGGMG